MRLSRLLHFAAIVLVTTAAPISGNDDDSLSTETLQPGTSSTDTSAFHTPSTETFRHFNVTGVPWTPQQIEQAKTTTTKSEKDVYDSLPVNTRFHRRARTKQSAKGKNGKGGRRPKKGNSAHKPAAKVNKKPAVTKKTKSNKFDLWPAVKKFDMLTRFKMGGTSSSTREISPNMMLSAKMPPAITFKMIPYTFQSNLFRARSQVGFDRAMVMLKQASLVKAQSMRPISGEVDLTQVMQQTMGSVVNEVLTATGFTAKWHMVGLGKGAIPDIALTDAGAVPDRTGAAARTTRAVIEVKTTSSMTSKHVESIVAQVERQKFSLHHIFNGTHNIPTLIGELDTPTTAARSKRQKPTKLLEQVVSEMYSTGARVGALTNLEDWLVLQRTGGAISMSHVSGIKPTGGSRGLEIMLGMSMKALGRK